MSRRLDPPDYQGYFNIGSRVTFLHDGERLKGEIVRTSSNPTYFHVEVDGVRYEVDSYRDDMEMVWK